MERVDPVSVAAPHAVTTSRSEVVAFLIMVAFLVVAPFFVYPMFLMQALCFALFACAFNLLIGYETGGGYDTFARTLARHMGQYIPGKPAIIARNMPGGGSRVAAAWLHAIAPKDGTALAIVDQALPIAQALRDRFGSSAAGLGGV